jgi:hypothetical protein
VATKTASMSKCVRLKDDMATGLYTRLLPLSQNAGLDGVVTVEDMDGSLTRSVPL